MDQSSIPLSLDQEQALNNVAVILERAGINLGSGELSSQNSKYKSVYALIGRAGSGKTALLSRITEKMSAIGVEIISGDFEVRKNKNKRSLSILAPTNKAANILRMRGVPATTIHRILYTPVYDPDYERIVEWLIGEQDEKPIVDGLSENSLIHWVLLFTNFPFLFPFLPSCISYPKILGSTSICHLPKCAVT